MALWMYQFSNFLAQVIPYDDGEQTAPPAPVKHPMSFSDLQQGLRADNNGETTSNLFRYSMIGMVIAVVLLAILLNLRQRRKDGAPPDSTKKLAKELTHKIPFPFGARLLLEWVARTARLPLATLLISRKAFDRAVLEWSAKPTFSMARRWGKSRLTRLRTVLFD